MGWALCFQKPVTSGKKPALGREADGGTWVITVRSRDAIFLQKGIIEMFGFYLEPSQQGPDVTALTVLGKD